MKFLLLYGKNCHIIILSIVSLQVKLIIQFQRIGVIIFHFFVFVDKTRIFWSVLFLLRCPTYAVFQCEKRKYFLPSDNDQSVKNYLKFSVRRRMVGVCIAWMITPNHTIKIVWNGTIWLLKVNIHKLSKLVQILQPESKFSLTKLLF